MRVWVDPKETAADAWGATDDDGDPQATSPAAPVFERALSTRYPVQYADGAYLTPMATDPGERTGGDGYARIQFNCAVDRAGTIKLTARGTGGAATSRICGSNRCSPGRRRRPRRCRSRRTSGGSASSTGQ